MVKKVIVLALLFTLMVSACASAPMFGDVTNDGLIDEADIQCLKDYILGKDVTINLDNADVNQDGSINVLDLLKIKRHIIGVEEIE